MVPDFIPSPEHTPLRPQNLKIKLKGNVCSRKIAIHYWEWRYLTNK